MVLYKTPEKAEDVEFESFYREHKDLLYRWAYSFTHDRDEAMDIVQEACMIIVRQWPRVREMENAVGYTLRIIGNLAKRRKKRPQAILLDDEGWSTIPTESDFDTRLIDEERQAWLVKALDTLKTIEKEVIVLRDGEEMDFQTLATHLGLNLSTAKSHYRRAKQKLLQLWEETYGQEDM